MRQAARVVGVFGRAAFRIGDDDQVAALVVIVLPAVACGVDFRAGQVEAVVPLGYIIRIIKNFVTFLFRLSCIIRKIKMRYVSFSLFCILGAAGLNAMAAPNELSGTWKYVKAAEYFGEVRTTPLPEFPVIQIVNGKLLLQPRCSIPIDYTKEAFDYNEMFQMALKDGVDAKAMDKFVTKQFGVPLSSAKYYYQSSKLTSECNFEHTHLFILKDKLVLVNGSGRFAGYERQVVPGNISREQNIYGRKFSELPYDTAVFNVVCTRLMKLKDGIPEAKDACAPVLFPYAATKADTDPLGKLIGSHQYRKNGAKVGKEYDNPVSHGFHPIFMLFPAKNDTIIAAVEDIEEGESSNRTGMTSVYLSIKADKVVDQAPGGCLLQADFSCVDMNGKRMFQLSDSGKFVKTAK